MPPPTPIRFIHTSDWQLGMTRAYLTEEASARFSQARIDAIGELGRLATKHLATFIVVAGDVFESNQLSRRVLSRSLDALKALPVPVFLLPGNHDPLDGSSIFSTPEFRDAGPPVHVITDMQCMTVPGLANVEVCGAPWRSKRPSSDLCHDLADSLGPADGVLRIAVAHGQVDALSPDASRPDIIDLAAAEQAVADGKFHYLALGDRHSVTEVGQTGRIRYSGAPVATAFDEIDPNKALLVELDEASCTVEPLDVGHWSFIAEQRALNGDDDVAGFGAWLDSLPDAECTAVKVGFNGSVSLATAAALDTVFERHEARFASLKRRPRTTNLAVIPDELDQDSVSLSGYAKVAWDELLVDATNEDDIARDALRLMYRLSQATNRR